MDTAKAVCECEEFSEDDLVSAVKRSSFQFISEWGFFTTLLVIILTLATGGGMFHIREIGNKYGDTWIAGIRQAPESEKGNIANAIAEWADGDSGACHIAVGGDYFCTRDKAKKAGN